MTKGAELLREFDNACNRHFSENLRHQHGDGKETDKAEAEYTIAYNTLLSHLAKVERISS